MKKTDQTPGAPAAQQNARPEKIAPAAKSDPIKAPDKTGQAVPTAPQSANEQQKTEKAAPAGDTGKISSDVDGTNVKSTRTAHMSGLDMRVATMDRYTRDTEAMGLPRMSLSQLDALALALTDRPFVR